MFLSDTGDGDTARSPGKPRLRDFLVERDVKELSLPVYDPNRGRLHPRELYAFNM